jgi:hypothetical protein
VSVTAAVISECPERGKVGCAHEPKSATQVVATQIVEGQRLADAGAVPEHEVVAAPERKPAVKPKPAPAQRPKILRFFR